MTELKEEALLDTQVKFHIFYLMACSFTHKTPYKTSTCSQHNPFQNHLQNNLLDLIYFFNSLLVYTNSCGIKASSLNRYYAACTSILL